MRSQMSMQTAAASPREWTARAVWLMSSPGRVSLIGAQPRSVSGGRPCAKAVKALIMWAERRRRCMRVRCAGGCMHAEGRWRSHLIMSAERRSSAAVSEALRSACVTDMGDGPEFCNGW